MRLTYLSILLIFILFPTACTEVVNPPLDIPISASKSTRLTQPSEAWDSMPFYVKVHIMTKDGYAGGCTGNIIGKKAVLTAAHCLTTAEAIVVERSDGKFFISRDFYSHPNFNPIIASSDVGVILFKEKISNSPISIMVSKLPDPAEIAILGGFRITRDRKTSDIFEVGRVIVASIDSEYVITRFTGLKPDHYPCFGSSGGGLLGVKIREWKVSQIGIVAIVSKGESWICDIPGIKDYHTRLDKYLNFIMKYVPDLVLS